MKNITVAIDHNQMLEIYDEVQNELLLGYARDALSEYLGINVGVSEKAIKDQYGVNYYLATEEKSPQYLLNKIVEKHEMNDNWNMYPEMAWKTAVESVLNELHDKIVNGCVPFFLVDDFMLHLPCVSTQKLKITNETHVGHDLKTGEFVDVILDAPSNSWFNVIPIDMSCFAEEDALSTHVVFLPEKEEAQIYLTYTAENDVVSVPIDDGREKHRVYNEFLHEFICQFRCDPLTLWKQQSAAKEQETLVPIIDCSNGSDDVYLLQFSGCITNAEAKQIVDDIKRSYLLQTGEEGCSLREIVMSSLGEKICDCHNVRIIKTNELLTYCD